MEFGLKWRGGFLQLIIKMLAPAFEIELQFLRTAVGVGKLLNALFQLRQLLLLRQSFSVLLVETQTFIQPQWRVGLGGGDK